MDDVALTLFINEAALALAAIPSRGRRRMTIARLRSGLIADLEAQDLDPDLATGRADMVVEAIERAMMAGKAQLRSRVIRLQWKAIASS